MTEELRIGLAQLLRKAMIEQDASSLSGIYEMNSNKFFVYIMAAAA